ncbi:MAG TPA: class I SAM-dependent methyltransferase, partial [Candidatus Acidoferrum sp.]|nr:class I SAM-dependent methyltransferase [Candidatus Acidoferrum sp.]
MLKDDYQQRLAQEKQNFNDYLNVHDLPAIFHYWSNKYLAPKFRTFGITDPEQFYLLYAEKFRQRFPDRNMTLLSIGCGNCDMEARLARNLLDKGIGKFKIECLDINEAMLERGKQYAVELGVQDNLVMVCADFNRWQPDKRYDVIIANQCLHHVQELEQLFALIKGCLDPEGYFVTCDVIGRNGHLRWPEALELVQQFWRELPEHYRYNRLLSRQEMEYINHDCSVESFEGIRAQDILPLLIENFHFELFIPYSNIILPFIDRPFGHNFNAQAEWDRDFIDRVHARDEAGMLSGELKPTQMLAVLRSVPVKPLLLDPRLTPRDCVRKPDRMMTSMLKKLFASKGDTVAGKEADEKPGPGHLLWVCNLCGGDNHSYPDSIRRETGACKRCGGILRFRSIAAVLTQRLFGTVKVLAQLNENRAIHGLGMSDSHTYADQLAGKFSYTNTFYHQEPLLDITKPDPKWLGANDFVITSDVFEHVPPPVQPAFDNLFALLKPGGCVVFSVPYSLGEETREHFPHLHEFSLAQESDGRWVLQNVTKDGRQEEFRNLVFHGGPGSTLEMREFSLKALQKNLADAGFTDVRVHNESIFEHGIFWLQP